MYSLCFPLPLFSIYQSIFPSIFMSIYLSTYLFLTFLYMYNSLSFHLHKLLSICFIYLYLTLSYLFYAPFTSTYICILSFFFYLYLSIYPSVSRSSIHLRFCNISMDLNLSYTAILKTGQPYRDIYAQFNFVWIRYGDLESRYECASELHNECEEVRFTLPVYTTSWTCSMVTTTVISTPTWTSPSSSTLLASSYSTPFPAKTNGARTES